MIGISSIRFALDERWELSIYSILIAAVIDGIDGKVARMLNATSSFGAELDSLCDFANFGLAPALIIYMWSFQQYEYKILSWSCMLLFIVAMSLRLARFNTSILHNHNDKVQYFFTGVPAPCGALMVLMPIILDFEISKFFSLEIRNYTIIIDIYTLLIAILTASRLPTISTKYLKISYKYLSLFMILFAFIVINLIINTWYFLPILWIIYLITIPICYIVKRRYYDDI
jgi:CDP-diacylglycerol--serine O-phosphatidyltransferase